MKLGICKCCKKFRLLTRHSEIGGHKIGDGWVFVCRDCHNKIHGFEDGRKNKRHQKGSGGKLAKGTRRRR